MTLREATMVKHKMAEQMPFNTLLMEGKLSKEQYVMYLISLYYIFDIIENRIELPTYMLRKENIKKDIFEIVGEKNTVEPKPFDKSWNYCQHLTSVSDDDLWPHVYLNYMALLFGGQIIKTKIPGSGSLYDFENTHEIIKLIREKQKDEWAEEVNRGYDFMIEIFRELENLEEVMLYYKLYI